MSKQYMLSALAVVVVSVCLASMYQSWQTTGQMIDAGLQVIIMHLTESQLYLRQQMAQPTEPIIDKENGSSTGLVSNYDLSEYEGAMSSPSIYPANHQSKPLIIYVEQFLTPNEIAHLIELAEASFKPSKIYDADGAYRSDGYRTSTSAKIKRHQTPVVRCIEQRFAQFQGDINVERLEPLQIVKYTPGQEFLPHYDWFHQPEPLKNGGQRVTTFVTYLLANCSQGETEFLGIPFEQQLHERFCDILTCDEESTKAGIRFRPIPGNSIFWANVDNQGHPDKLTRHAGRPTGINGHKIGLNTWTRERPHFAVPEE